MGPAAGMHAEILYSIAASLLKQILARFDVYDNERAWTLTETRFRFGENGEHVGALCVQPLQRSLHMTIAKGWSRYTPSLRTGNV
jgi:hypothetical protein